MTSLMFEQWALPYAYIHRHAHTQCLKRVVNCQQDSLCQMGAEKPLENPRGLSDKHVVKYRGKTMVSLVRPVFQSLDTNADLHKQTHIHTHSISRKALIATKAIRIDTFTVRNQLVDPFNNAVNSNGVILDRTFVPQREDTHSKKILTSGETVTFSKMKTYFALRLWMCVHIVER